MAGTRSRAAWYVVGAAAVAAFVGIGTARGQSSAVGDLGAGGSAKGDISSTAGEEDRIGVDLAEGSTLTAKLTSNFAARVELLDPNDAPTGADFGTAATKALAKWPVPATGKYHFRVWSADSSQGVYTLTAAAAWSTKVVLTGATGDRTTVALPAGAIVKAVVIATPANSFVPTIASLTSPAGTSVLAGPVAGAKGAARLGATKIPETGKYVLIVTGGGTGDHFQASLSVKVRKVKATKSDLRNGLTTVSYAKDGVGQMMKTYGCVNCHSWATAYSGVTQHAQFALPRMQSGQMPAAGPRVSAADVDLFQRWIAAGMKP